MSKSQRIKPLFQDKHRDYMRAALTSTISVAEGAVRAGKTIDNVTAFARMLANGVPDRFHLATGSTSANAKLNIGDCNGFGLEHIFRGRCRWTKYKGNEALAIKIANRQYIVIFAGAAKADSFKKIRGNSYGMWIATEINLHHSNTIKEAMNRQLAARVRRIFWDLNPESPNAWIYKEYIDRFADAYGEAYNYQHFTIRDNASITAERLAEIESQYDPNSIWYKRDILGQRCNAEGLVYDCFSPETHVLSEEKPTEGDYYVSCDFGIQNATVFLLWQKETESKRWICLREWYYSGRDQKKQKTVGELVEGLKEMLGEIKVRYVIVDPSAAALIEELRRNKFHTMKANNNVKEGISDVSTMLRGNNLAFMAECKNTVAEFGLYLWDEKAAENGEDKPIKDNDHAMDAVRYFVKTMNLVRRTETKDVYIPRLF